MRQHPLLTMVLIVPVGSVTKAIQPGSSRAILTSLTGHLPAYHYCVSPLHPVFTPAAKDGEDPFRSDNLPENLGYYVQMKDGVVYVYADKAAAARGEPKDLPYPNLEIFIDDMNFLLALIAQGPV